ncbi:glycosyltransferase family 4 protein [Roseivirga thermotolerans]|uniref:Glycosyltransferase WbuB n=1 Tax=Roseivirga thermotolerans TaxID=1758176 RepID=A0ABQ3I5N8_9BACT|nr:glycosyltransferase family 4 protein [Roseivirga thermotolerans]GHE55877.1 glycosyltransferase WbuB [Roseivirga thermotolerans]
MAQRILYIHQYFKTPLEGGAIRSYYLAKGLVENGYEVEMLTSHNEAIYTRTEVDGITVHYLPVRYANEMGFLKRIWAFLKFVKLAKRYAKSINSIDKAYITSTPLTVGLIGLWLKKKRGIPYIFEVRDLWPTAPIELGAIRGIVLKSYLYRLEKKIYTGADKIVALSPGMRDWIVKTVPEKEVFLIPNMADCQFFRKEEKDPKLAEFYHAREPFIITYIGSIGVTNHLEYLLDVAALCKKKDLNIGFKVVGQGSQLSKIKLTAYLRKLSNVEFIGHQNKEGVRRILNITDATYVCFANIPVLGTNSPNKMFDSLASGKLTIVNSAGWTKDLVEQYECGFYAHPEKPEEFLVKLMPFIEKKELLEQYKNNARQIAEKLYSKKLQVEKLTKVLSNENHLKASESEVYILTA